MTERQYESSVPDDLSGGTPLPSAMGDGSSNYTGPGSPTTTAGSPAARQGALPTWQALEAKSVASDAVDSGRQVAETAASGVKDVAAEATTQLRQLFDQARTELDDQASSQGQRAASGLRSLSDELRQMASTSQQQGLGRRGRHAGSRPCRNRRGLAGEQAARGHARRDAVPRAPSTGRLPPRCRRLGLVGGRMTRGLTGDSGDSTGAARVGGGGNGIAALQRSNGRRVPLHRCALVGHPPVRSEPYSVGVRDTETHAATSPNGGVRPGRSTTSSPKAGAGCADEHPAREARPGGDTGGRRAASIDGRTTPPRSEVPADEGLVDETAFAASRPRSRARTRRPSRLDRRAGRRHQPRAQHPAAAGGGLGQGRGPRVGDRGREGRRTVRRRRPRGLDDAALPLARRVGVAVQRTGQPWLGRTHRHGRLGDHRGGPRCGGTTDDQKIQGLPRTTETAKRVPDALKGNEETP